MIAGLAFDAAGAAAERARERARSDDIDEDEAVDARAPVIWVYDGDDDDDDDDERYRDDDDDDDDRYRDDDDDDDDRYRDDDDRSPRVDRLTRRARGRARGPKPWQLTIGPYLWAASVDADVSLGSSRVSAGGDFMDLQRNARYGAAVLAEARYRRFAAYGDVMYGVVGVGGAREVGPLMVTLDGTATSLMVDGAAGYQVAGGSPDAALTLEARLGVRYQRTAITGAVTVGGADVANPRYVDAAADALVGAQVVARPVGRLRLVGTFDLGVYGVSTVTWSATAEAGVRLGAHVVASVGWRTLTTQRPDVSIVMHGPRAAVQLSF
ncbi:MAG: hypothetical protein JNK64_32890 [Myxococcales bacterium]|nr:hypothetical protein [Myxococcales bacterium]